jgi:hypothetical protein
LRHDLDHPLNGARLFGELEAALGVTSTFFVQTACDFYNLLSKDTRRLIRDLADAGHEIGLHYDSERYFGKRGRQHMISDLQLLEDLSGHPIISASQHIPIDSDRIELLDWIKNEAYAPRFTESPMNYISDSLMVWRQTTPHDLLNAKASFQFLSHPDTWASTYRNIDDALSDMMKHEIEAIRTNYSRLSKYYRKLLRDRSKHDRDFRRRRHRPAKPIGSNG